MTNKKLGIVVMIAIVVVSMFAGCVEEETPVLTPTPTATPTPEITESPTPTATPMPTLALSPSPSPLNTPKYTEGNVIGMDEILRYSDTAKFVYDYDEESDRYRIGSIHRIYGIWVYTGSSFNWRARENVEQDYPNKYDTVDFSEVMGYNEYWDGEYRTWMDGYVLPTEEKERESWYEILKFSGDEWDEGRTKPFAVKGEQWSIKAEMNGDFLGRNIYLYREGETENSIFRSYLFVSGSGERNYWRKFVHGSGNYYLKIEARSPEDEGIRESGEWEIIIDEYY